MGTSATDELELHIKDLITALEKFKLTKFDIVKTVADQIREKHFNLTKPPYQADRILNKLGIETIQFEPHNLNMLASKYNIDFEELDGIYFGNGKKVVCTNKNKSEFTKAHEIFEHLFYGFRGYKEKHFNCGAAEFLMPEEEFKDEALGYGYDLYELREIYSNCSPFSISVRLCSLGLVDNVAIKYKEDFKKLRNDVKCNLKQEYNIGKDYTIWLEWR